MNRRFQEMYAVVFAALVGSLPTIAMLATSLFGSSYELSAATESNSQNYCAGLIFGAIAKELFPMLNAVPIEDSFLGISVGFFCSLLFSQFLDYMVGAVELAYDKSPTDPKASILTGTSTSAVYGGTDESENLVSLHQTIGDHTETIETIMQEPNGYTNDDTESVLSCEDDNALIQLAFQATSSPLQRDKIVATFHDMVKFIRMIQDKSQSLMICLGEAKNRASSLNEQSPLSPLSPSSPSPTSRRNSSSGSLVNNNTKMVEIYADEIDQDIHQLQYHLDHCRRMLQGAGSDIVGCVPRLSINEDQGQLLQNRLYELNSSAMRISSILQQHVLSKGAIKEIHTVIDRMDGQINQLHETVEDYNFKWRKRSKITTRTPIPQKGSYIPLGLLIPVVVDSMVDGFFMGSTW